MDYTSTPEKSKKYHYLDLTNDNVKTKKQLPGKLSMNFVMQFARVYYVEQKLPLELSGFVLN